MLATGALCTCLFTTTALQCVPKPLTPKTTTRVWNVWTHSVNYVTKFGRFWELGGVKCQHQVWFFGMSMSLHRIMMCLTALKFSCCTPSRIWFSVRCTPWVEFRL